MIPTVQELCEATGKVRPKLSDVMLEAARYARRTGNVVSYSIPVNDDATVCVTAQDQIVAVTTPGGSTHNVCVFVRRSDLKVVEPSEVTSYVKGGFVNDLNDMHELRKAVRLDS